MFPWGTWAFPWGYITKIRVESKIEGGWPSRFGFFGNNGRNVHLI